VVWHGKSEREFFVSDLCPILTFWFAPQGDRRFCQNIVLYGPQPTLAKLVAPNKHLDIFGREMLSILLYVGSDHCIGIDEETYQLQRKYTNFLQI